MCKHNETDGYDCDTCCYRNGVEDAQDGEPRECDYKNWSQVNNYFDGYDSVKREAAE